MKLSLFLLFISLVAGDSGYLLLQKTIDSEYAVHAPDVKFKVILDIFNAGKGTAYEVRVEDSWPAGFVVDGSNVATFAEIPAEGHQSFNFTVTPKQAGEYETPRAVVTYQVSLDGANQTAFSTSQGSLRVIDHQLYNKLTAK